MFAGLTTPVIWMQNVVVDLLLGLGFIDAFRIFADHVRDRYGAEPGFITMNLPRLLDALDDGRRGEPDRLLEHQQARLPDVRRGRGLPRRPGRSGRSGPSPCRCSPAGRSRRARRSSGSASCRTSSRSCSAPPAGPTSPPRRRWSTSTGRPPSGADVHPTDPAVPRAVVIANPVGRPLRLGPDDARDGVRGLAEHGWEVLVICGPNGPCSSRAASGRGIEVLVGQVPVIRKCLMSPRGPGALAGQTHHRAAAAEAAAPRAAAGRGVGQHRHHPVSGRWPPGWPGAGGGARARGRAVRRAGRAGSPSARPLVFANSVVFNSETSRAASGSALLDRVAAGPGGLTTA